MLSLLAALPANAQMDKVKTVWVIRMENHSWTGNNAGAGFGAPDIKGNPLGSLHQWRAVEHLGACRTVFQSSRQPP